MLDDRFEQHDGAKVVELAPGKFGIIGHGWAESRYVHLWKADDHLRARTNVVGRTTR